MKYTKLVCTLLLLVLSRSTYSQEKMEIEGAIIISNSEDTDPTPGTIRFNSTTCDFEGWNGVFWASLTGVPMDSVEDIDGNTYKTITIGKQEWMAENLRTTKYKNEDVIPNVTNDTDWSNLGSGAYCWDNNDNSNEIPYGKLYNWYAVADARGLCPATWNVPTDTDWTTLIDYLDPSVVDPGAIGSQSTIAGGKMKETGLAHWLTPNIGATNSSGFTGLPGDTRQTSGFFYVIREWGYWWSRTESGNAAWYRAVNTYNYNVERHYDDKRMGHSVRCVKN